MDRHGKFAAHTGSECVAWCGHICRPTLSVAGNILAGEGVLKAMVETYEANAELPFARRLITTMRAGDAAGGDTRGRQSAALLIHDQEDYSLLDLRVDDHPDPLAEIARLEEIARTSWVHFRRVLPSAANPSGMLDRDQIQATITASIAEGYE
jgi:uncharacterized Ntn-hydrolase superfamily protein